MNINFDLLEIQNFQSFVGLHSLDFSERGIGLHFMRGKNEEEPRLGANNVGKTSTFNALSWCLYGRTPSGLKNQDVRPWKKSGDTLVSVHLKTGKEKHVIERSINPNRLNLDGKEVPQENIDALLQINFEMFLHTVLLGQGKPLFFDLEPRKKMELFSEVLNLDRWDSRSRKASEKTTEHSNRHLELTGECRSINLALDGVERNYDSIKEKSESWSSDQQKRLEEDEKSLKKARKEHAATIEIKEKADLTYDGAMVEVKALRIEITNISDRMLKLSKDADIVSIKILENDRAKLKEILQSLGEGDKCPTCSQPIKGTDLDKHKSNIKKQIRELNEQIAPIRDKLERTQEKFDELKALLVKQQERLKTLEKKAEEAEHQLRISAPDVARLEALIHSLTKSISGEHHTINPFECQLQLLRRQKSKLNARLKELDKEMTLLEQRIERTKFWIKGFKDIQLFIIEEVVQELELATNAMLPEVGLDGWEVKFDIERETKSGTTQRGLNVHVMSPSNMQPVSWASWGGGAQQRLRVASALALGQVLLNHAGTTPNMEILDEPTRSLSTSGVRDLCDFLATRAETLGKQIWLIDHMARESSQFESVVTIVKDSKGSHIRL
jgi:DNA repair exonuclease SbcCD ATPase subunit